MNVWILEAELNGENMFAIGVPPGHCLPFTTVVVNQISFEHSHRDRAGFTWKEPMTVNIHVLAVRLDALRPANNDNESVMAGHWE
jgi:hypothetical protein